MAQFPEKANVVIIGLGGIVMTLVAVIPADPLGIDAKSLLILAFLGGIAGPAGRIAIATATRHLPAAQVSLPGSAGSSFSQISEYQAGYVKSPVATTVTPFNCAAIYKFSRSRFLAVAMEYLE